MDVEHSLADRLVEVEDRQRIRGRRVRRALIAALIVLLIGAAWWYGVRPPPPPVDENAVRRPVTVAVATVAASDLPLSVDALGTVTPLATVTVRTRIAGHLTKIAFAEGQLVKKGDLLAEIDPRPYAAALAEAEGQLAREQALLRNAETDLARYRRLIVEDAIARQQLDTQEALVRQYRASVKVGQAQVDAARLDLDYCRIVSPIDGRVGLRLVDAGNFVQPGDANGIVVVTQVRPISVVFTIPEDDLQKVLARLRAGARLPVTAYDRSGTTRIADGWLATVDNRIDPATGTVRLRAIFDNADEALFPNQFVVVRLLVDTLAAATLAPRAAVQRGAAGTFVYVVQPDNTVSVRPVTVGIAVGEGVHLTSGVAAGETVVIDGLDRLREGSEIRLAAPADGP